MAPTRITVFYDGDCGFCKVSVAVLLRWDRSRRLYPMPIQEPEAQQALAPVPPDRRLLTAHVRTEEGTILSGAEGAPTVLRQLPRGARLARLAAVAMPLAKITYRLIASTRSTIGPILPASWRAWATDVIAERRRDSTPPRW
jgi:predicted DCC family thiol-disulfide oxidoreductase YuxK